MDESLKAEIYYVLVFKNFISLSENTRSLLVVLVNFYYYATLLLNFYPKIKENNLLPTESFTIIRTFMKQLRIFFPLNRNFTFKTMYVLV